MPTIKFTKEHHDVYPSGLTIYPAGYEGEVPQHVADQAVLTERAILIEGEITQPDPAVDIHGDGADEPEMAPAKASKGR